MNKLLSIFLLLLLNAFALAQTPGFKIRGQAGVLTVTHRGRAHRLNLPEQIDAAKITETEILFAARQNAFLYLVIDVSGQSKAKSDDRQCGAGIEANFIWIKLDSKWKILDSKSVRYESCWSSIANDNYRKTNDSMYIEIENFRDDIGLKLTYNADQPEKGFQIIQAPLAKP